MFELLLILVYKFTFKKQVELGINFLTSVERNEFTVVKYHNIIALIITGLEDKPSDMCSRICVH